LCGLCAEDIKHRSQRGCEWTVDPRKRLAANRMLAELRVYELPAAWLGRAAEHCAGQWPEDPRVTAEDVLACWRAEMGPYRPGWGERAP